MRKKKIMVWTIIADIGLCCMLGLCIDNVTKSINGCIVLCMMIILNHIGTEVILNSINYIEISGDKVTFKSLRGKTFKYFKKDVERVSGLTFGRGYKLKLKQQSFRIDYNQDDVKIIVDGTARDRILPIDFSNAIWSVEYFEIR